MEQMGLILDTVEDKSKVEVKRISGCGSNCAHCAASCEQTSEFVTIENTLNAKVGDYVEIRSDSKKILRYILLVYGLPLLFFIISISMSFVFLENLNIDNYQLYSLLIGLAALIVSYYIIRFIDGKSGAKSQDHIVMTRIVK